MAEVLAIRLGTWVTAIAIEYLAGYFADTAERSMGRWTDKLQKLTTSAETEAIQGMHQDLRVGMTTLSASISTINHDTKEQTAAVLRKIVELRESQHLDQQQTYLRKAVDAIDDLRSGMYGAGNPKNVGLLKRASENAQDAARSSNGSITTKLQAYRLWVVTEYMHEVAEHSCVDAKRTAITILGRVIYRDPDLLGICRKYSSACALKQHIVPELTEEDTPDETSWVSWSGSPPLPQDVCLAIEFLLEITSSVGMLPPLDQEVSCSQVVTAISDGALVLGPEAPRDMIFAMGRYCASNPDLTQAYPTVSTLGLAAWQAGKERLAMDNFFASMGGEHWELSRGWTDKDAELGNRLGVTVEGGHVTKIHLAANNLQGVLNEDIADCENLRELVLHGNSIVGAVPPRVRDLLDRNPDLVVTGLPTPRVAGTAMLGPEEPGMPQLKTRCVSLDEGSSRPGWPPGASVGSSVASSTLDDDGDVSTTSSGGPKKQKSFFKTSFKFIKEAVASDFDAGCEKKCPRCSTKMSAKEAKNEGASCHRCSPVSSAPEAWG